MAPGQTPPDGRFDLRGDVGAGSQRDEVDVLTEPGISQEGARQRCAAEEDDVVRGHSRGDRAEQVRNQVVPTHLFHVDAEALGDGRPLVELGDGHRFAATRA